MRIAFAVFSITLSSATWAQDHPTVGLVFHTNEWRSLSYNCELRGSILECEFSQASVRLKATQEDIEEKIAEDSKKELEIIDPTTCTKVGVFLKAARANTKMPEGFSIPKTPEQRADLIRLMSAMQRYCDTPTRALAAELIRVGMEPETRTCLVSTFKFRQTFAAISEASSAKKKTWVVRSTPKNECGVVQLDRFEPEDLPYMKGESIPMWSYTARKAVTNPKGEFLPGVKCDGIDESTYFYTSDVQQNTRVAKCDYIEFTPL